eukprot:ANDGO_02327.mRNA.1 Plant intracellular Ras-group-related LRR protein 4
MKTNSIKINKKVRKVLTDVKEDKEESLDLHRMEISQVPRDIGVLMSLIRIDLSQNMLASLPPDFGNLVNLKTLNLKRNFFTDIPPPLLSLFSLESLDMSYNVIESIPGGMGGMKGLKKLDLTSNRLHAVGPSLGLCSLLEVLVLRENKIATLPAEVGQLSNLKSLDMAGNPLQSPLDDIIRNGPAAVLRYLRGTVGDGMNSGVKMLSSSIQIEDKNFSKLVRRLREDCFPDRRLDVLLMSLKGNYFSTDQAVQLMKLFEYPHMQAEIAVKIFKRIIDPAYFFKALQAVTSSTCRNMVQRELKLGVYSEKTLFDPEDPAGYYRLDASKDESRAIIDRLCDLEAQNLGENLKFVLLDGRDIDLFNVDHVRFQESRGADGFIVTVVPEMVSFGGKLNVKWKAPASRADFNDWIGITRVDDPDGTPPLESSWILADKKYPGLRAFLRGKLEGSITLEPYTASGPLEIRYYCESKSPDEEEDGDLPQGRKKQDKTKDKKQAPTDAGGSAASLFAVDLPDEESGGDLKASRSKSMANVVSRSRLVSRIRLSISGSQNASSATASLAQSLAGTPSSARSNTAFVAPEGFQLRRALPSAGTVEIVYLSYDDHDMYSIAPPPVEQWLVASFAFQILHEFSTEGKQFELEGALNAFHFTCQQLASLFHLFRGMGQLDEDWVFRMCVTAYARCTDRSSFLPHMKGAVRTSVMRRTIDFLRLKDEGIPEEIVKELYDGKHLSDEELQVLLSTLRKEQIVSRRIAAVRKGLDDVKLTCSQLRQILGVFKAQEAKADLTTALHQQLSDSRQNFRAMVEDVFDVDDREAIFDSIRM